MADGKGFSLSFGANKSSTHRIKRVKVNEEEEKLPQEYLTGFSERGAVFRDNNRDAVVVEGEVKRVIPTQGNNFRGLGPKAFNPNRFLPDKDSLKPSEGGEDHFEQAAPEEQVEVTYGLNMMGRHKDGKAPPAENGRAANGADVPEAPGRRVVGTGRDWEAEAFKNDVEELPDTSSLEEYEAMPVELFGQAMLRGMGWSEEREAEQAKAKEFVRRAPLLGLGATAAPKTHKEKRFYRPGESREAKKDMVVYDSKGNIKHTMTADDKLEERRVKGPAVGKRMRIIKGRHSGLMCTVTAIQEPMEGRSQTASVKLAPSQEQVSVRLKELGEPEDKPQGEGSHSAKEARPDKHRDREREADYTRDRGGGDSAEETRNGGGAEKPQPSRVGAAERPWLAPHIRVKIIDKGLGKGRLYLKKGEVMDVMSPTLCSLRLEEGGSNFDVRQDQLETVVPKNRGARVFVVSGRHRGQRAKLLERNGHTSQAAIQLTEDLQVVKVQFDEVAEFYGELGEEE